ncbi:MAG TPA: sigma-70 family RNA polymerase sigma factor [Actinomycetota bacterium]|nr:sigma-70 family RNA polymerase sigma factor [Actinomycetota bacterium]
MHVKPAPAYEALYREHAERLWRAVFASTGDREVASDAVAEAFAQCLRRGQAVRSPKAWLWKAAFRIAAGEMQRRRRSPEPETDRGYEMSEGPAVLLGALRVLPERQRAVLVLHYYAGYKAREIAGILGSSAATVRVHLSRGRRRLRELLEETDG